MEVFKEKSDKRIIEVNEKIKQFCKDNIRKLEHFILD